MTTLLFSLALVVLTVALIAMSMAVKHLSDEIDELKEKLERHQKLCDWQDLEQRLTKIEDELDLIMWYDGESQNKDENQKL